MVIASHAPFSLHEKAPTRPKWVSTPLARLRTTRSAPWSSPGSPWRCMARKAPPSLKAKVLTPSIVSSSPPTRSNRPRSFSTGFLPLESSSRSASDLPMENASHLPSLENVGRPPCSNTSVESVAITRSRSSLVPSFRRIVYAIQRPSGERTPAPSRSH